MVVSKISACAREGLGRLALHERRARHRFDAAGDRDLDLAGAHRPRRRADRIEAGAAEAVDGGGWHGLRQAGEQRRHAGDIAVVLAGLVGAAGVDLVDGARREARRLGERRPDDMGEQVVRPHRRQRAAVAPDRRAHALAEKGFSHDRGSAVWTWRSRTARLSLLNHCSHGGHSFIPENLSRTREARRLWRSPAGRSLTNFRG